MKRLLLVAVSLTASPVLAEVCDKQRPGWNPADGPVSELGELHHFLTSPSGIMIGALAFVALCLRRRWLSVAVLILLMLQAILSIFGWFDPFDITLAPAAHVEGCQNSPLLIVVALNVIVFGITLFGLPKKNFGAVINE